MQLAAPRRQIAERVINADFERASPMVVLKLAAAYGGALAARPLETKIATGALVAGLGDALAQLCDPSTETFSWPRSQCFVGFGGLYTGAWQHFCFGWLTTHCTGVGLLPGYAQRALLNQGVVVPLLYAPLFLLLAGATRGLSLRNIIAAAAATRTSCSATGGSGCRSRCSSSRCCRPSCSCQRRVSPHSAGT